MSESQNIEWKETGRDEYVKWVCGFANAQGGDGLWLRFPLSTAYQVPDSSVGRTSTQETTQEQEKTREKTGEKTGEKILTLIAANPSITTAELANQLEVTAKGIEWQISKLKKMGVLEWIGPARGGHWRVVETKDE